jgi:hypothetical protein
MPDIQLLARRRRSMIRYPGTSTLSAVAVAIMRGPLELSDEAGDARYDGDRPDMHDAQSSCPIRKLRRKGGVTSEFGRVVSSCGDSSLLRMIIKRGYCHCLATCYHIEVLSCQALLVQYPAAADWTTSTLLQWQIRTNSNATTPQLQLEFKS